MAENPGVTPDPATSRFLVEIMEQLADEVAGRLTSDLQERDRLAVSTAIMKGAVRGLLRGAAEVAGNTNEHWLRETRPRLAAVLPGVDVPEIICDVTLEVEEPDPWADRYKVVMELALGDDERAVLLRDLDGFMDTVHEVMRAQGHEWDPHDPNTDDGIALLVSAHDDLSAQVGPWTIEGSYGDLELLLTRLRRGSLYGLEKGAEGPDWAIDLNLEDPERTDEHLETVSVCDALLARLRAQGDDR